MSKAIRPLFILILAVAMFMYPQEVLSAAAGGIELWGRYVLPALLPFFILSDLFAGTGLVHFLGVLLEPLMRPLFRLPGKAAFVVAMGYSSGFPMGAVLTAKLRQEGEITRAEGERLLSFTNNPSPGFIFGAVAAGLLGRPGLGPLLAGSVYLSNLAVGILFRFYGPYPPAKETGRPSLRKAWQALLAFRAKDDRPLGRILGQAVQQSVTTVLAVGGYIAFFAVLVRLLTLWKITLYLAVLLHPLGQYFLPLPALKSLLDGLLEMTLGCQGMVKASSQLGTQVAGLALIMGWSGLSVFAQVAGFISATDLRLFPFALARFLHAFLALILSQVFLRLTPVPVSGPAWSVPAGTDIWLGSLALSARFFLGSIALLFLLAFLRRVLSRSS
ncbi:Hypothetical protein DEACI_3416 [Acididesulfobacillus acetoxydans]|uniref:Sporulation integral membrane protein YlbJ n=1 Tax=Acididesulfobacillus acetoxydans TaxID=1561005 RepID=A0A8S0Y020_9FIRM|nr:nucleoside recognition domain-containing protein [Acididesulfobacillus acetoxydans]CAA7602737.1 Hypothetical protein DEACI_3416 [Acididesulfobacillus acetoxydans]CEJ06406.1 Sporulation integral membrane protein YlbJ [Acididesulfobacillus acetoxydans]